jgi:hypothetical protein
MTRLERDALIDRYLGGDMSPAEEQDFFIQAAVDKDLRRELKAQQTIASAIRKDSVLPPEDHLAVQVHVAAMLGVGTGKVPAGASKELGSVSDSPRSIPRIGTRLFSGLVLVALVTVIAIWLTEGGSTPNGSTDAVMVSPRDSAKSASGGKQMAPSAPLTTPVMDSVKSRPAMSGALPTVTRNSERNLNTPSPRMAHRRGATDSVGKGRQSDADSTPHQKRPSDRSVSVEGTVTVHVPK